MLLLASAGSAGSLGEPLWSVIPKAVGPAVTAAVALTVTMAGYFRFVRGRVFQPRLTLEIIATTIRIWDAPALLVEINIKNEGQSGLVMDPCFAQSLDVFLADKPVWEDALKDPAGVVLWYDGAAPHRHVDVLQEGGLSGFDVSAFRGDADSSHWPTDHPKSMLEIDGYVLEPGERERRALLIPVSEAGAYLLQLSVHACTHAGRLGSVAHARCVSRRRVPDLWQTRYIVHTKTEAAHG